MVGFCCFPEFGEDGFFADVATVRRVLAEAWNVEFVDLTDLLSDMIFLAKILCFFQLSVSKGAGTCGNGQVVPGQLSEER